jgi:peptidoglycan/LPS O-acetylase OafA/YrhL
MLFAAGALVLTKYSPTHRFAVTSVGYSWLASLYLCAILCVVTHPETWLARLMRALWLGWLGSIAYGVYLVHQTAAIGIFRILRHSEYFYLRRPSNAVGLCIALLVTLALCSLSWRYFEKPLVQFRHRSAKSIPHSERHPGLEDLPLT